MSNTAPGVNRELFTLHGTTSEGEGARAGVYTVLVQGNRVCWTGEGEEEEREQEQERRKACKKKYKALEVTGRREWTGLAVGLLLHSCSPCRSLTVSKKLRKEVYMRS